MKQTYSFRIITSVLLACAAILFQSCFFGAENTLIEKQVSPNGQFVAYIFDRSAGATTDFSTQVSIFPTSEKFENQQANVFTCDSDHGAVKHLNNIGGPEVGVEWKGDNDLEIAYPPYTRIFLQNHSISGIHVVYREKGATE